MIAILGATGTIGRSLARALCPDPRGLVLFARRPELLASEPYSDLVTVRSLDAFSAADFDLVINAIGAGDPGRVAAIGANILSITEEWDRRVLDSMARFTRYVFLSSGAIHALGSVGPADQNSARFPPASPYATAKLAAEKRHRGLPERSILDVRVFAYADAALPREGRFFLCELARSIRARAPFKTSPADMVRDYAGRTELAGLIKCWDAAGADNAALDLYTKAPARKSEILDMAQQRFGLRIEYCEDLENNTTAATTIYTSRDHAAATLGYAPERTALEVVGSFFDDIAESPLRSTDA